MTTELAELDTATLDALVAEFVAHVNENVLLQPPKVVYPKRVVCSVLSSKWYRLSIQQYVADQRNPHLPKSWMPGPVYCFVARMAYSNRTLGDVLVGGIYKHESFSRPAPHVRGFVQDKATWTCAEPFSIAYRR